MDLRFEKIEQKEPVQETNMQLRTFEAAFIYGNTTLMDELLNEFGNKSIKLLNNSRMKLKDILTESEGRKMTNKEYNHLVNEFDALLFDDKERSPKYLGVFDKDLLRGY